jgi:hypothetical protein
VRPACVSKERLKFVPCARDSESGTAMRAVNSATTKAAVLTGGQH